MAAPNVESDDYYKVCVLLCVCVCVLIVVPLERVGTLRRDCILSLLPTFG